MLLRYARSDAQRLRFFFHVDAVVGHPGKRVKLLRLRCAWATFWLTAAVSLASGALGRELTLGVMKRFAALARDIA